MPKFKVGDRVRVISKEVAIANLKDPDICNQSGMPESMRDEVCSKVGTVAAFHRDQGGNHTYYNVILDGSFKERYWSYNDWMLVPEKEEASLTSLSSLKDNLELFLSGKIESSNLSAEEKAIIEEIEELLEEHASRRIEEHDLLNGIFG